MTKILLTTALIFIASCTSINESGRAYFRLSKPMAGVETPAQVIKRTNQRPEVRRLIYGQLKPARILQCTILRNQLYVAALKGTSGDQGKEIANAASLMEKAYQEDDQAFLSVCDQILSSPIGKTFWAIAEQYVTVSK